MNTAIHLFAIKSNPVPDIYNDFQFINIIREVGYTFSLNQSVDYPVNNFNTVDFFA